ncbi:MAG TPA: polysaccharide deacetylase family protein [Thermaerobacter sp.]
MHFALDRATRSRLVVLAGILALLAAVRLALELPAARQVLPAAAGDAVLREVATDRRQVALTFDVMEGSGVPSQVLDALARMRVRATFFASGSWARDHGDLLRRMAKEGHQVETLGFRAGSVADRPVQQVLRELRQSVTTIQQETGRPVRFLRPPAGGYDAGVLAAAREAGLRVVLWSLDSHDWANPGVDYIVDRVARHARPGSIVRLSASDFASQTPRAVPAIVEELAREGLRPVTLDALLQDGRKGSGGHTAPGP